MDVLEMQLADAAEYLEIGNFEKAVQICDRILADQPAQVDALRMRGIALFHGGVPESALKDFVALIEQVPDHAEAWVYRAFCERQVQDEDAALISAQKAHEIDPTLLDAMELLLILHAKADQVEETEAIAAKILELEPDNGTLLLHRGNLYLRLDRYEEAIADFTKLLKLGYQEPDVLNQIAAAYARQDQFDKALPYLQHAIEQSPYDVLTMQNLGFALIKLGDEDGLAYLNKAIKYEPEDSFLYRMRGEAMLILGDPDGALEDFQLALELGFTEQHGEKVNELIAEHFGEEPAPETGGEA